MRHGKRFRIAAIVTAAVLAAAGCTGTENQSGTGSEGRIDYLNLRRLRRWQQPPAELQPLPRSDKARGHQLPVRAADPVRQLRLQARSRGSPPSTSGRTRRRWSSPCATA